MRFPPALASACLAALLLGSPAALAQTARGWVDPPAKSLAGPSGDAGTEAKSPQVKSPDVASPGPGERTAVDAPAGRREAGHRSIRLSREIRRAEREERDRARRMAASGSEIDTGEPDPRVGDRAAKARRLTEAYLASVSSPNEAMLAAAPGFYGERVRFHGRSLGTPALLAEKRRFVRRWPERRYVAKEGTMRTACHAASETCVVRTVMDFRAGNPARNRLSRGSSELTLTVGFEGRRPVIVAETSRVLHRGSAVVGASGRSDGGA